MLGFILCPKDNFIVPKFARMGDVNNKLKIICD